ncbi:MAG: chitobiase/beta-hexosaminidase C-terminal domain-containing protein, partial [Prevotellaceae bacterium]|nr:chitobiase/beta-hexosaminidase C-terminal domain-containing protein [Prevotellaceae bacterium]
MKKLSFFMALSAMVFGVSAQDVVLDFTSNAVWNLPVGAANKATAVASFSNGNYSITLEAVSPDGYYFNSTGSYLMLGKAGAKLTLPAFTSDVEKIEVVGNSGASTATVMNVYVGDIAVSTATTGIVGTNTYLIDANSQTAGTVYSIKVTSAHNAQITAVKIYFVASQEQVATPVISPDGGAIDQPTMVSITCATAGADIYYTTDGTTPS